jgi:hypothetical protein
MKLNGDNPANTPLQLTGFLVTGLAMPGPENKIAPEPGRPPYAEPEAGSARVKADMRPRSYYRVANATRSRTPRKWLGKENAMKHQSFLNMCMLCGMVSTALNLGCAHSISSESTRIRQATWQANLDDCREVSLSFSRVRDREEGQPVRSYEQLTLEVRPRPHLQFERVLKSIELKSGAGSGRFTFGEIEVRADEARRRVWFVDRKAGRVIATLDRDTGVTTGPDDEPPTWATPDGGVPLDATE